MTSQLAERQSVAALPTGRGRGPAGSRRACRCLPAGARYPAAAIRSTGHA